MSTKSPFIFIISILIFITNCNVFASLYSVPDSLYENANSIVLDYRLNIEVISTKNAKIGEELTIVVLNESGKKNANFFKYYSTNLTIRKIKASILDEEGEVIKTIKGKDFDDYSATEYSLISDDRVKYYDPHINKYPFTIKYELEYDYTDGYFDLPIFLPVWNEEMALLQAKFTATFPKLIPNKIFSRNINDEEIKKWSSDVLNSVSYTIKNFKAIESEPFSESFIESLPTLKLIPHRFEIHGHGGSQNTWQTFGNWIYRLSNDQSVLSEKTRLALDKIKAESKDDLELMSRVYEFMQNRTRYVSIQLGIGGWKPMSCYDVDRLGYGDCKALANYTKSLYEYLGIPSIYTLVRAGSNSNKIHKEIPHNQFNHAILCIPNSGDTLWLECTSQTAPFGHLGKFTDERNVLLIKSNDSHFTKTRSYSIENNIRSTFSEIKVDQEGGMTASERIVFRGLEYDKMKYLCYKNKDEFHKELYNNFDDFTYTITTASFENNRNYTPEFVLNMDISSSNYTSKVGSRLFVPIIPLNKYNYIPSSLENRKTDIKIRRSRIIVDTVIFNVPENFKIEYLIENTEIKNDFGQYKVEVNRSESKIELIRRITFNKGIYRSDIYEEFREFFIKISKLEKDKIILKKII